MESSAQEIHENLNAVIDYQTHHRLRETQGRHRAEELNERIMIWSIFVTVAIFSVGFGQVRGYNSAAWLNTQTFYFQVFVLKSFFAEKRPSQMYGRHWDQSWLLLKWSEAVIHFVAGSQTETTDIIELFYNSNPSSSYFSCSTNSFCFTTIV